MVGLAAVCVPSAMTGRPGLDCRVLACDCSRCVPGVSPHAMPHAHAHVLTQQTTGTPVAVFCEHEGDVAAVAAAAPNSLAGVSSVYAADAADSNGRKLQLLEWQSYLKEGSSGGGGGGCGCG